MWGKENVAPGVVRAMDPVEVFCRVRPVESPSEELCACVEDNKTINLFTPESQLAVKANYSPYVSRLCYFTHVFDSDSSQKDVFERVSFDLVADLALGKDGLLFTYGITGSGKTYTMTGNPREAGILPRCLDVIFNSVTGLLAGKGVFKPDGYNGFDVCSDMQAKLEIQQQEAATPKVPPETPMRRRGRKGAGDADDWEMVPRLRDASRVPHIEEDNSYAVFVSYIEIYNNYVYDLLDSTAEKSKPPQSKGLRTDVKDMMYVNGVTEVEVQSTEEAFDVLVRGQKLRRVAHTVLNTESSRSHSVFNIRLVQAPLDSNGLDVIQDKTKVHVSQLSLVDLAGSERSSRTQNVGDRMKETGHINTSLMVLRQCIDQLRKNQVDPANSTERPPFRESKLTYLFKNYFIGQGKVRMVVCLSPQAGDFDENLHVMQFSEMVQEVEVQRGTEFRADDGLTPGRRRAAKLQQELMAAYHQEERDLPEPKSPAQLPDLFDPMPALQMRGPTDEEFTRRLRQHYQKLSSCRREYCVEVERKQEAFESILRRQTFEAEATRRALEETQREKEVLQVENRQIQGQKRQLQHDVQNLRIRLGKYETDVSNMHHQEEAFKKKEREMAARVRLQDMQLKKVQNILERPVVVSTPRKNDLGGSQGALNENRNSSESASSRASARGSRTRTRRAPTPPPRTRQTPYVNTRHRRSKSTGFTIDHRPPKSVPGQYFQPKLPNAKVTKKPRMADLEKADDYVMTVQDVDPATGAPRTSLFKGDVHTTAGGGTAVVFDDVETVTHRDPVKRKSDSDEKSIAPQKRGRIH